MMVWLQLEKGGDRVDGRPGRRANHHVMSAEHPKTSAAAAYGVETAATNARDGDDIQQASQR